MLFKFQNGHKAHMAFGTRIWLRLVKTLNVFLQEISKCKPLEAYVAFESFWQLRFRIWSSGGMFFLEDGRLWFSILDRNSWGCIRLLCKAYWVEVVLKGVKKKLIGEQINETMRLTPLLTVLVPVINSSQSHSFSMLIGDMDSWSSVSILISVSILSLVCLSEIDQSWF